MAKKYQIHWKHSGSTTTRAGQLNFGKKERDNIIDDKNIITKGY